MTATHRIAVIQVGSKVRTTTDIPLFVGGVIPKGAVGTVVFLSPDGVTPSAYLGPAVRFAKPIASLFDNEYVWVTPDHETNSDDARFSREVERISEDEFHAALVADAAAAFADAVVAASEGVEGEARYERGAYILQAMSKRIDPMIAARLAVLLLSVDDDTAKIAIAAFAQRKA